MSAAANSKWLTAPYTETTMRLIIGTFGDAGNGDIEIEVDETDAEGRPADEHEPTVQSRRRYLKTP